MDRTSPRSTCLPKGTNSVSLLKMENRAGISIKLCLLIDTDNVGIGSESRSVGNRHRAD